MTNVVYRIEDGIDRREVTATTYQMRNFYNQFGDGFFSVLDVMNYIQHHQITKWCKKGNDVLDVCCGRGLLLPLLRYNCKDIGSYTGVDIEPRNAIWRKKRVTNGKPIADNYYPFATYFVESNVDSMAEKLLPRTFDVIIYTSSIEHMQKSSGQQSLIECRKVAKTDAVFILTCPRTPEDKDGYDTQYAAHVYEWKRTELLEGLKNANWRVDDEWGLLIDRKTLNEWAEEHYMTSAIKRLQKFVPSEWLLPVFAPLLPKQAKEVAYLCRAI